MIAIDNDRRSKNKNGRYTLNSYRIFSLQFGYYYSRMKENSPY